ncbi:MAG: CCA tRNA nucleotidyltransferase [Kiritimatiellae bacterium]|nr:CCA tRNA nucleotidyltransferase [Kiritimatiellia bacterium]
MNGIPDIRPAPPGEAAARHVLRTLRQAGHTAYYAGGCVRDKLLDRTPKDYDIATSATPDAIEQLFPRTVPTGRAFGVMNVIADGGASIEVATFRRDAESGDGRRPDGVQFSTPEEDARRRDFTINGLFFDPETGNVLDYVGGRDDLRARLVRAIGSPRQRFAEDHLRMLRAVRFASTLEFALDPETAAAVREGAGRIERVSAERIQQELTRLLVESPRAGQGLRMLHELGLLQVILPEVAAMAGQHQPPEFHPEGDVLTHTVMMLDAMQSPSVHLAYSVLLHDVGKPLTAVEGSDRRGGVRLRFDRHADVGADVAETILRRLKMPLKDIEIITHCTRNHMRFMDARRMREATLRRLVGAPTFSVELELHRLDCVCSHGDLANYDYLADYQRKLAAEPVLPPRWVTGRDVLDLGVPEGPQVGQWLERCYDLQLEGGARDRDELLAWLRARLAEIHHEP